MPLALRRRGRAAPLRLTNADLDRAFASGELSLVGQPKIRLGEGTLVGAEAFLRWRHPRHGELPPAVFLPQIDAQGRSGELTRVVLDGALRWAIAWRLAGRPWSVSINLAVSDLLDATFPASLKYRLQVLEAPRDSLTLELPAMGLLKGPERALLTYTELAEAGMHLAFDGPPPPAAAFEALGPKAGTELKIHRSFIPSLDPSCPVRTAAEIADLIATARALGVETIAVGVENEDELDIVEDLGFDLAQGRYFCPPAPFDGLEAWARLWAGTPLRPALLKVPEDATGLAEAGASTPNAVHHLHQRLGEIFAREEAPGVRAMPADTRTPGDPATDASFPPAPRRVDR